MRHTLFIIGTFSVLGLALFSARAGGEDDGPARKLLNSQGCKACHSLEGDRGSLAKSFTEMRATLSRADVRRALVNPSQRHAKSKIRDFSHLQDEEIEALVDFVLPEP